MRLPHSGVTGFLMPMQQERLPEQLYESARRFGASAVQAFTDSEPEVFLLHAATSLEHLMKAVLATRHPSLIAGQDFDSLLHTVGLPQHARRPPQVMRTIGMREAIERCMQLVPALGPLGSHLALLMQVRNGLVHLGQLPAATVEGLLVPYLEASELLLEELGTDVSAFWGRHAETVESKLEEARQATRDRVAQAIQAAKKSFDQRFGQSDPEWREERLRLIVDSYDTSDFEVQLTDCPACRTPALLEGILDVIYEPDFDYSDGRAWLPGVSIEDVTYFAEFFRCRACGLRLNGTDELTAAGIDVFPPVPDYDPEDLKRWDERRWRDVPE